MNCSDNVMAKKKKCNLNFLDNVYTTFSGFKYNDDNCSDGFKRDLDYILKSITYKSIISFTCSCTIGCLFTKIEGFYENIDGKGSINRHLDNIITEGQQLIAKRLLHYW